MNNSSRISFSQYDLDNGLHVILAPSHHVPLVVTNLWYQVGSKDDPPKRTGFAHLFEHMMFQGSQNVKKTEHFKYIQKKGGSLNATTSFDRTNYFETLPSTDLATALWLESDRLLSLDVTKENFENQRAVVKEERRQRYDNRPYGTVWEHIVDKLWPTSGYHWTTIGSMDHLDQATVEDAQEFHAEYYKPNNCTLTLVGDFKESEAKKLIDRYFGMIPKGTPVNRIEQTVAPIDGVQRFVQEDVVKLPGVYIAFQAGRAFERDEYAMDLLGIALGQGDSSRLYQELVYRRKIAHDIGSANYSLKSTGSFNCEATVQPESGVSEVEQALWNEIEKVRNAPLKPEELEKAKNCAEMATVRSLSSLGSRADRIQEAYYYTGDPASALNRIEIYRSITAEEIQDAARRYLDDSHCVIGHVVPK